MSLIGWNGEMIEYENLEAVNTPFLAEITRAIQRVVESGWYILGTELTSFEAEFATYTGRTHCVGVANGLDALTLSLRALELPAHTEVLVASNTYIATILAVLQAGLTPVLVEPDVTTCNMDPALVPAAITKKSRVICVTHLYGKPCRMDAIMAIAREGGLQVIEDCAQSHGARFADRMTGTFGAAGCFSFYPTKNLGALGDAGAVTTDDANLADRLRHWRNYGSKQKYVNVYPGVNSRLDEIQAAALRAKLPHLDKINAWKRKLATIYDQNLPEWVVRTTREADTFDVFHIYPIRCHRRDALRDHLLQNGVKTEIHYPIPPHMQHAMRGVFRGAFPISEAIHASELSLPISFSTSAEQVLEVCRIVRSFEKGRQA
jgi:dTDP-4-amino-4,6-dideoxygalactose transaminase